MTPATSKILFIVTSAARIGPHGRSTGYEFSEVAHPYLVFASDGHLVEFASPAGGLPPEDGYDPEDTASRIFRGGHGFRALAESTSLDDVDPRLYDAIFFPGGLGPMVDLAADRRAKEIVASAYDLGRIVGAVCHGPVALLGIKLTDGSELLGGRRVTGFSTAEEEGYSIDDVPFLLEDALGAAGAHYSAADPFAEHVVRDGRLITGQNPASAVGVAQAVLDAIASRADARL